VPRVVTYRRTVGGIYRQRREPRNLRLALRVRIRAETKGRAETRTRARTESAM